MSSSFNNKQQAFTAVVRPHLERLYRLPFRLTGNRDDAQDLVTCLGYRIEDGNGEISGRADDER